MREPDAGRVTIGGFDPYARASRAQALRRVALMPQDVSFPKNLTAHEVVAFVAWLRGVPSRQAGERAGEALAAVGLADQAGRKTAALSGGMIRRVALAQALVSQPEVLLLDEPSTGLDPQQRRTMIEIVQGLSACVLFSSQVIEDIESVASRALVIDHGRVLFHDDLGALEDLGRRVVGPDVVRGAAVEAGFLGLITRRPTAA